MGKRILSILIIYIIVFSNVSNCYVYADYSTDSKVCDINGINDKLVVSEIYKDESSGSKQSDRIIVSLGDSYSSGEGIPPFYGQYDVNGMDVPFNKKVQDDDWLAHRSMYAWSGMLNLPGVDGTMAENKGTHWYFAAVSGAETKNIQYLDKNDRDRAQKLLSKDKLTAEEEEELEGYGYQKKEYSGDGVTGVRWLEPQLNIFDKLGDKKADYVTITIGGNDLGFVDIIAEVVLGVNYFDKSKLWSKVNNALKEISDDGKTTKALKEAFLRVTKIAGSSATVIVVGYPLLFEYSGKGDVVSILEALKIDMAVFEFDKALEKMVNECDSKYSDDAKLEYVSVINAFENHEAYSDDSYINPVILSKQEEDIYEEKIIKGEMASAYSMHPNLYGSMAYADCVQSAIDSIEGKRGWIEDSVKDKYKNEYLQVLYDHEKQIGKYSKSVLGSENSVVFYDINGDGIPELFFVSVAEDGVGVNLNIYTYDESGVKELYNDTMFGMVANTHHQFCVYKPRISSEIIIYSRKTDSFIDERYKYFLLHNRTLGAENELSYYKDIDFGTEYYKYGVEITEERYKELESFIHKSSKVIICNDNYVKNNQVSWATGLDLYTYDDAIVHLGGDKKSSKEYKKAYLAVLNKEEKNIKRFDWQYSDKNETPTPISLCDIDGDGIPELIFISVDEGGSGVILNIYTYDTDGAKKLYSEIMYYNAQLKKSFCLYSRGYKNELILYTDASDVSYCPKHSSVSIKNGVIKMDEMLCHNIGEDGFAEESYEFYGEEITKERYEGIEESMHTNAEVILYADDYLRQMKINPIPHSKKYALTYDEAIKKLSE